MESSENLNLNPAGADQIGTNSRYVSNLINPLPHQSYVTALGCHSLVACGTPRGRVAGNYTTA